MFSKRCVLLDVLGFTTVLKVATEKFYKHSKIHIHRDVSTTCHSTNEKHGIHTFGYYFMVGNPYEDEATIRQTIRLSFGVGFDYCWFSKVTPMPTYGNVYPSSSSKDVITSVITLQMELMSPFHVLYVQ